MSSRRARFTRAIPGDRRKDTQFMLGGILSLLGSFLDAINPDVGEILADLADLLRVLGIGLPL
jgi:hypothetical protein